MRINRRKLESIIRAKESDEKDKIWERITKEEKRYEQPFIPSHKKRKATYGAIAYLGFAFVALLFVVAQLILCCNDSNLHFLSASDSYSLKHVILSIITVLMMVCTAIYDFFRK